jgi:hypothetical protein
MEMLTVASPVYIPAAVIGLSTIACIFGANLLNRRHQASIASAYALLSQSYQKYRKAAGKVFGEDADSKIRAEMAKERYLSGDGYALFDAELDPSEKVLFYDDLSQRYFTSSLPAVMQAQYHINRNFVLRGDASINEFYHFLGLEETDGGDELGWGQNLWDDGYMWIDFENKFVKLDDGIECYIVSSVWTPEVL